MKVIKYLEKILFSLTVSKIMLMLIFKIIQKKTSKMYYYGNLDIINNISKNTLIIFPHFRGNEIRDVLMSENIRKKTNLSLFQTNAIVDKRWKPVMIFCGFFRGKTNLRSVLYTKNNAVKKASEKIKKKEPVGIFIYNNTKSKGLYYIVKETKCPILIVKKNKVSQKNKTEKKYKLSYIKYDYDIDNKEAKEFMDEIKEILFK